MKLVFVVAVAIVWLYAAQASALTCTATGCTFDAVMTEPTTNTAGGPVNLTGNTLYYKVNGGTEKVVAMPVSGAAGGGVVTKTLSEPVLPGQKAVITGQFTSKNAAGESVRSAVSTFPIDRSTEVVPNPPVGGSFR